VPERQEEQCDQLRQLLVAEELESFEHIPDTRSADNDIKLTMDDDG